MDFISGWHVQIGRGVGGAKGLIQNSKDLCKSSRKGKLNMKGQNGKQFKNNKYVIKASCPKKKK